MSQVLSLMHYEVRLHTGCGKSIKKCGPCMCALTCDMEWKLELMCMAIEDVCPEWA